ncbi:hypothetical protein FHS43_004488 [Streptosporangium becharense]|uniref:Uncharacterized protein n=1 Tax=Streptosporangium becharense TaxID=1816182 RepID=A0A7W9IL82_9ACTN|nr:hypothetical protein [Streptosporangium becharense]MBB2913190.1 hypothetical protein [Streptosporangium becharense]MBB5822173.1 hypothetical protein [Streptosporangium becharense]
MPPYVARLKTRDIRSAARHGRNRGGGEAKVVDLRAYAGRNVVRFPRPGGPTSAA